MPAVKEMTATKPDGAGARPAATEAPAAPTRAGNPFAFLRRFAEDMDRLMEDFGMERGLHVPGFLTRGHELLRREAGLTEADWSPRVDVCERDGRFLVRADLPGLTRDEIHVELTHDMLTIRGERKREVKEEREGTRYSECSYGRFYRGIPLPEGVDTSKATAEFRGGVLEVAMPAPKPKAAEPRRLTVVEKS